MHYPPDLIGKRFGNLTVIASAEKYVSPSGHRSSMWLCECDCEKRKNIRHSSLVNGCTTSCGCFGKERHKQSCFKHGYNDKDRLYRIWEGAKNRCVNPKNKYYPRYGGRGITFCDEWLNDFIAFRTWALSHGYKDNLTLDRIDNNKGYSPDNCRWVGWEIQASNKRSNHYIELDGENKTISQWARTMGGNANLITDRLKRGWNERDAIMIPPGGKR